MLAALLAVGAATVQGFLSGSNVRSMLLLGAFLGLASVGQTLCALLGGLDLSIPYLIGSANIGTLYMISSGVPAGMAIVITLVLGVVVGTINGLISLHLQNQALIVTLGVGFATVGGATQVLTSAGASNAGGGTSGVVPDWLANISSLSGETLGLPVPPVILIWLVLAAA